MSHGASPAVAAAFGFAVLMTAGIAHACPAHATHETVASTTVLETDVASPQQTVLPPKSDDRG